MSGAHIVIVVGIPVVAVLAILELADWWRRWRNTRMWRRDAAFARACRQRDLARGRTPRALP